jgi:ribosomal protein S18 acetylase RimI-like enzyme
MRSVGLRPAEPADSEFCFRLHRATLRPYVEAIWGWDESVQREFHERGFDPAHTQIVTVDGRDAGVLVVHRRPTEIYLGRIAVDPAHQGRGIGSALIRDLLAEAAGGGLPLVLDVLAVNTRALALYERLGLREVARHGENNVKIQMRAWRRTPT